MEFSGPESSPFSILDSVYYVLENYGWYLLICAVAVIIIYNKKIQPYVEKYKKYRFEEEYAAKYHKNPDLFSAHVNAQQKFVEKLQEKYNKDAEEHERKMKEREEKKRQEIIEKYGPSGSVLGGRKDDNKPTSSRLEYNPLSGPGSSSNYRPPRRSPCGGGGCGKK